jgi:2-polyprenyl-6-methoxyphenol hydroxylase-like FAD-dependent oxidoreductase
MEQFPVLIVGGSLSGLTTAALLAQHGVRCVVVERHAATTVQYKFRGISPRSMEIYRGLGIEAEIRAHRTGDQKSGEIARAPNLASPDVHFQGKPWADVQDLSMASAETCDQDRLEPILRAHAEKLGADIRFGTELVELKEGEDGVIAVVQGASDARARAGAAAEAQAAKATGAQAVTAAGAGDSMPAGAQTIKASYVIACDGVNGRTRERIGIGRHGPGVLQHWMNLIFDAGLEPFLQGRRITSCFVMDINGTLVPREDRWLLALQYAPERGEKPEDFDQQRTEELVRKAAGRSDIDVKLFDARSWEVSAYVADRFSSRRVFIVGDAAHTMPPTGGFGGNTGIHDAHNLAWKLALVTKGLAGSRLLETYDAERRPIVEATLGQALARLAAWFRNLGERLPPTPPIAKDDAVIFGQCYGTGTFEDPRAPSGAVGSRAPHVRVEHRGQQVPVHDLVGREFLLVSAGEGDAWEQAAGSVARELGIAVNFGRLTILAGAGTAGGGTGVAAAAGDARAPNAAAGNASGASAAATNARAYDLGSNGAVLIRPDGIIAWRSPPVANPTSALRESLLHLLAR